jgi:UDP-N-acetylglucosamine 3-dehydrogenase
MTLKVAVIGIGSMGRNHARVYWEMPEVKLVGVADANEAATAALAQRYSTRGYGEYRRMLDECKPDAVTVAVPTVLHQEVALEVIRRGIHILVEKPIAFSVAEGRQIIAAAEAAGVKLMIGHIERFNPAVVALKAHMQSGELGRIFQIDAHRQGPFPARISDVGVVIDLAVHDIDIMRHLTQSDVVRLYAETEYHLRTDHEDLLTGLVRLANGTVGTLTINWLTPTKIRELMVTGERGMYRVDLLTQDLFFYENPAANGADWETLRVLRGVAEGRMTRFVVPKKEPLRAEQEAFLAAVRGEAAVAVPGADGLRALELAQGIITSGIQHCTITY